MTELSEIRSSKLKRWIVDGAKTRVLSPPQPLQRSLFTEQLVGRNEFHFKYNFIATQTRRYSIYFAYIDL